jgi:acyl-CoA synthetase (AMP-forming)/AMP-acid ligase II
MDVSIASVSRDTGVVPLSAIKKGMHVTAASFAEALKNIKANDDDSLLSVLKKLPKPVPIDQIKIIDPEAEAKQKKLQEEAAKEPIDWIKVLWIALIVAAATALIVFLTPWIIWQYYNAKARNSSDIKSKAFNSYRAAMYYLNQIGYTRTNTGPSDYARNIDALFKTNFASFSNVYQKLKYSSYPLTDQEKLVVPEFYKPFISLVRKQVAFKTRFIKFLNIYTTINWFTKNKKA